MPVDSSGPCPTPSDSVVLPKIGVGLVGFAEHVRRGANGRRPDVAVPPRRPVLNERSSGACSSCRTRRPVQGSRASWWRPKLVPPSRMAVAGFAASTCPTRAVAPPTVDSGRQHRSASGRPAAVRSVWSGNGQPTSLKPLEIPVYRGCHGFDGGREVAWCMPRGPLSS